MTVTRILLGGIVVLCSLLAFACGGDGEDYRTATDNEDFHQFAKRAARATEKGDIAFFTERVSGISHTCTQAEVDAGKNPQVVNEICTEVGQQFESAVINGYGSQGIVTTVDGVKEEIAAIFEEALPDAEDNFGDGTPRLYALTVDDRLQAPNRPTNTALLSSMIDVAGVPGRTVVGVDFTWSGEQWLIESILTANFPIASELLEPTTARVVYEEWEAYE